MNTNIDRIANQAKALGILIQAEIQTQEAQGYGFVPFHLRKALDELLTLRCRLTAASAQHHADLEAAQRFASRAHALGIDFSRN